MAVHKPSVAVTMTVYVEVTAGLAVTLASSVALKPVAGFHAYVKVPLLFVGITVKVADEPLQIVWFDIAFRATLGLLTVTTTSFLAVAVHEPSVAVATTV